MIKAVDEAKAVLADFDAHYHEGSLRAKRVAQALSFMIAENERLRAIPADVEELCKQFDALVGKLDECGLCADDELTTAHSVGDKLRAYAARESARDRVDAEVRAKIEAVIRRSNGHPWEATWNEIRAILDTAKPAPAKCFGWATGSCAARMITQRSAPRSQASRRASR